MTLREAIKPYRDCDGLILDKPWAGTPAESGNGLLYLAVYGVLLARDRLTLADVSEFERVIKSCEVTNGRFKRSPYLTPGDACAWDDYVGIASLCKVAGIPGIANRIAKNFPVEQRRFPGVPAFYRVCAGESISFMERVLLSGTIYADAYRGNANGHVITWLITEAVAGSSECVDRAIAYWREKMREQYGTVGVLMGQYFTPNHPFSMSEVAI